MSINGTININISDHELELLVKYLSFANSYQDTDPLSQLIVRDTLSDLYMTLGKRHMHNPHKSTYNIPLTYTRAACFWKYYECMSLPKADYEKALITNVGSKVHKELNKNGGNVTNDPPTVKTKRL